MAINTQEFLQTMRTLQDNPDLENYSEMKLVEWYKQQIRKLKVYSYSELLANKFTNEGTGTTRSLRPLDGSLNLFMYSPKGSEKLPYYDTFPLVIPIRGYNSTYGGNQRSGAGFLGLNFHYLPYLLRFRLLIDLLPLGRLDDSVERLFIRYPEIKDINLAKPTIKRYLLNRVRSDYRYFSMEDYMTMMMTPIENFKKKPKVAVWADSRRIAVGDKS